ncbi:alpha/beta family hydrolase [Vibrio sp. SCSIO 43136]|uniref:alpha/beta family hydrolase n=1 Tax=Vibrio sp. SCSIO 43136 TaxID=2819101 RepID=UPI00207537F7|nr:alpha/beta family hydrolase [Vibrio sp. SCSIO 43136]USD65880.1 dienelactone hydrolase family protein [Vibrio sp. SCSIO 43136]
MDNVIINGDGDVTFLFAHGAGAGIDHAFMQTLAEGIASHGIKVVRFNFPYMIKRGEDGKKRPPDRAPKLIEAFEQKIAEYSKQGKVFIGGKSMGGRMASLCSDNENVAAVVCMGFPFHPPGKPENFKGEHMASLTKPCLIAQGDRDPFGTQEDIAGYKLSDQIELCWIPDGEHSFKPRKRSGYTEEGNLQLAIDKVAEFILREAKRAL